MKPKDAARVFGCASVLLAYPGDTFASDLSAIDQAVAGLPDGVARAALTGVLRWLSSLGSLEAASTYVDTFDLRRKTSLHLTYYRYGDTRERGEALVRLVAAFRAAGYELSPTELPDYLPALLELAAVHPAGAQELAALRPALDALVADLQERGSPYAGVLHALIAALPPQTKKDRSDLRSYLETGPPTESVGLDHALVPPPYAPVPSAAPCAATPDAALTPLDQPARAQPPRDRPTRVALRSRSR